MKLNPVIRGWVELSPACREQGIFSSVDEVIYQTIRRWARRRHRWKSNAWVVKKYFTAIGGNNWVFSGTVDEHPWYLTNADSVPMIRHVKIRAEANPYDPKWESYFEKRLDVHMAATLKGKRWLFTLWKEQRRTLSSLYPKDHQDDRLAQPSHSWTFKRGMRLGGEPSATPSHLSPTRSQPGPFRNEAAPRKKGSVERLERAYGETHTCRS